MLQFDWLKIFELDCHYKINLIGPDLKTAANLLVKHFRVGLSSKIDTKSFLRNAANAR
jgi:hypothetical protein